MKSEAEAPKFSSEALMVLRPAPEKKFYNFGCFCFKSQTFSTFMILNFFWKQKFFFGKGCFADGGNFFLLISKFLARKCSGIFVFGFSGFRNFKFRNLLQLKFFRISKFGLAAGVLVFRLGGGMATPSRQE